MSDIRNLTPLKAQACVDAINALRQDMLQLRAGAIYHASRTPPIDDDINSSDGYDGYDAPSVRINNYVDRYHEHIASVVDSTTGVGAHLSADATNVVTAPVATGALSTVIDRCNDLKAKYNLHRVSTVFHPVADNVNEVTAADATDLASALTLMSDLFTQLNAHFAGGFTSEAIVLIAP